MTTASTPIDRATINRRNAQKSTGPRTPEGKNRSKFNAVKHGMTARTLVLPDEDANVLQFRLETWIADLQPQNDVERFLVEQAVHSSWRLERAGRAEVARLSHIIESVPEAETNRQREEAAALGRRLFSDRDVSRDANLNREILNALLPGRKSQSASRPLDVLDHPEAIVLRLESTPAGCQWLLDRWTELHDILAQVGTWKTAEKVKVIRLLGKPPLKLTPQEWENECERRRANPCPEIDARINLQLDRQLDDRLDGSAPATLATLQSVAAQAIARLEMLVAGHRQRAEAEAARQADILSFDTSAEGERLRRYHFSCSRSLFRSLDTLMKVRRSGLGSPSEEGTELPVPSLELPVLSSENEVVCFTAETTEPKTEPCSVFQAPSSVNAPVDERDRQIEATAPPVDHANRPNESPAPPVAEIVRARAPFLRALFSAIALVGLLGAAVRGHGAAQDEPTAVTVVQRNRQNEAITASRRVDNTRFSTRQGHVRPRFRGPIAPGPSLTMSLAPSESSLNPTRRRPGEPRAEETTPRISIVDVGDRPDASIAALTTMSLNAPGRPMIRFFQRNQ